LVSVTNESSFTTFPASAIAMLADRKRRGSTSLKVVEAIETCMGIELNFTFSR